MDWKDALAGLRDSGVLPEGEPEPVAGEPAEMEAVQQGRLHVSIDRKGRKGKTATIIEGFDNGELAAGTAAELKRALGTGGSVRGCEVLVQGDVADKVREFLKRKGWKC